MFNIFFLNTQTHLCFIIYSTTLQHPLLLQFLHHLAEFIVPFVAEAADEGFAKEDI